METLKEDLEKSKITFDTEVLLTDLINEYGTSLENIDKVLQEYISAEEKKGNKFEKRFLVFGEHKEKSSDCYAVANGENSLKEWLTKLKNAQSSLYSIQIAGGAKKPERKLQPVKHFEIRIENIEKRPIKSYRTTNGSDNSIKTEIKSEPKVDNKKSSIANAFAKKATDIKKVPEVKDSKDSVDSKPTKDSSDTSTSSSSKKTTPETKKSTPENKKPASKDVPVKKGINSFFTKATPNSKQKQDNKNETKSSGVIKPPTPKKMEDFFKKQTEKPTPLKDIKKETPVANTSVQLFKESEDEEEEVSSDEEEKLEALKRDIISSDHENEPEEETTNTVATKRRRIVDSDEEDEEPQKKHKDAEKESKEESEEEQAPQSETYIDDDGFVITIKPKKSNIVKKPSKPSSPVKTSKSPAKSAASSSKAKANAPPSKTKQGNIMSFFSKK